MLKEGEDRVTFVRAIVERVLLRQYSDRELVKRATGRIETGLRVGRDQARRPPNPRQQPLRWFPELMAKPWHDPADIPEINRLEESFEQVRAEMLALFQKGWFKRNSLADDFALSGDWLEYRFFANGHKFEENCARSPKTVAIIESIPGAATAGSVYFAAVTPGTHLRPHYGPHNARLRCHLGLVVPAGCAIRVGGETRTWQEGKCLVFDDSFEHELWNRGANTRIVLIVDIWHPELAEQDIAAIRLSSSPLLDIAFEVANEWHSSGTMSSLR